MGKHFLLLCLGVGCLSFGACGQVRDSIYLYNGQVLIGDLQSVNLGTLSIDDLDLKVQNIRMYKIRRIRALKLFKIETIDKRLYYGMLYPGKKDGWIVVRESATDSVLLPMFNIHHLIPLNGAFFKRLDGSLSAGFSYAKSSGIGQVNLSANVGFATRTFEYELQASEIGSIDSSKFSRDNENVQLFIGYDLSTVWFLSGVAQYQRNLELSISRRFLEMVGGGNKLVIKDTWQLLAITGMSFTQELSTEGVSSGTLFEIPLMFRFNFYQFHHPNIQITASQTAYFSLSETGRIRYDGNTNFSWELIRYFYLGIDPYTSFDNKPPAGKGKTFDFGIAVSLSYKF